MKKLKKIKPVNFRKLYKANKVNGIVCLRCKIRYYGFECEECKFD